MKSLLLAASLMLCTNVMAADPAPPPPSDAEIHAANQRLGRGMNLGNALEAPQEGDWGVTLKPAYFLAIKEAGFSTVRLPVRWSAHAKADAPYTIDEEFAKRVDWAVDQATANHLNIVINIHLYEDLNADPDGHLPRLLGLWRQIAARYANRPATVYFELLNEPNDKWTAAKWNAAVGKLLAVVRHTNPTRAVIVGPVNWNSAKELEALELPTADRRLILTIHFYEPFTFTHQGASWIPGSNGWKGQTWTGTPAEQTAIRESLDQAVAWAKKNHRPVFLGEFGTYEDAPLASRVRWTEFVVREAEARGFSWAYWEFCSGFGAYDAKTDAWRKGLKAALLK
ncbi:MAG: glycoside hydrolase family 5 protein [Planctomycetes bacterium]|nr:glycoside hydrolase family 5 protein [Planctomycetota bacterium]